MIKTAIGLHVDVLQAIKAASESRSFKVDWMGFENTLREILRHVPAEQQSGSLQMIDDALAAFTKRGNVFPETV